MKKLLNTLYVLTPDSYLFCRNETICVRVGGEEKISLPAIAIDGIVCFGQTTVSTPLIGFCGERGIDITFLSSKGRFLGRVCGPVNGNVLLRKKQYESLSDTDFRLNLVRDLIYAKIRNSKGVLLRHGRSAPDEAAAQPLYSAAEKLSRIAGQLTEYADIDALRGIEGAAGNIYFSQFDHMLIKTSEDIQFAERSRRPPQNPVNATLSFVYMLLAREMQSAMETVGLDPAAGYLHSLRPGRPSFALDLLEELRAPLCDRFVLSLFNKKQLDIKDFETDTGVAYLNEKGRKKLLSAWQRRKTEEIIHPFLEEKVQIGIIPYAQAMLFARVLRGDLDRYPPFIWR